MYKFGNYFKNMLKMLTWRNFSWFMILTALFFGFQHTDLVHTFSSSYAYINGHFSDFYDYNKKYIGGNDYLPVIYLIFAFWNLPLYFLNLIPSVEFIGPVRLPIQIFWSKLLLVVFFVASAKVLSLIARELVSSDSAAKNRPIALLFASSPIVVLVIFAFGHYDILGVFFVLAGYYFYIKKDMWKFVLLFSMAISFKYFAFVIFLPLLLMVEKNPIKILKWLLIVGLPFLIQIFLYSHSDIFLGEIFTLLKGKAIGSNQDRISFSKPNVYMLALYGLGCAYLYFKKYNSDSSWHRDAIFVPIIAYGLMFSAVVWHPQWMVITMPFFALSYIYIRNTKWLAYVDTLASVLLVWIIVNVWANNLDMNMLQNGLMAQFIPSLTHQGSDFLVRKPVKLFGIIFNLYLFSPAIIYLFEVCLQGNRKRMKYEDLSEKLIAIRFIVAPGLFLMLALLSIS